MEQRLVGFSTRRYARSLEPLPSELAVHGVSKSAVSEGFVIGTEHKLRELMRRDLSGFRLVALMIGGVHFSDHVVLAAVGIDTAGEKYPLGLREVPLKTLLPAARCSPTCSSVGATRTRPCWS